MSALTTCNNIQSIIEEAIDCINGLDNSQNFIVELNSLLNQDEIIEPNEMIQQLKRIDGSIEKFKGAVHITNSNNEVVLIYEKNKEAIDLAIFCFVRFPRLYNITDELETISNNAIFLRDISRILSYFNFMHNKNGRVTNLDEPRKRLLNQYLNRKNKISSWESSETTRNIRGEMLKKHRNIEDFCFTGRINFKQSMLEFCLSNMKLPEKQYGNQSLYYRFFQLSELNVYIKKIALIDLSSYGVDGSESEPFNSKYEEFYDMVMRYKNMIASLEIMPLSIFNSEIELLNEIKNNHKWFENHSTVFEGNKSLSKINGLIELIKKTFIYSLNLKLAYGHQNRSKILPA